MQIPALGVANLKSERSTTAGVATGTLAGAAPLSGPRLAVADLAPVAALDPVTTGLPRPGLQVLQETRNARVASAQQAVSYLDRLTSRLQRLKVDLGSALAGRPVPAERLEQERQALSTVWQQRLTTAGGQLDNQLRYQSEGTPVQGFTVRGLDANAPVATARETLTIAVGIPTTSRPAARVLLDPSASAMSQARSFDQALMPLGLRAEAALGGGLRFEVEEARWPQVREQLAIQGEGRRFPAGRLNRVQTDADASALTPQALVLHDGPEGRASLQQVVDALARTDSAREAAREVLNADRDTLITQRQAGDADWAQGFVADFAAATQDAAQWRAGSYGIRAALGAAISGLSRPRVMSLLTLR
jgi:hypothetical protein